MALATITNKGQVTIPKPVRNLLNLDTGSKIEFIVNGNREALLRPISKSKTVDDMFGKLDNHNIVPISIEEMNEAIKQKMKDSFK